MDNESNGSSTPEIPGDTTEVEAGSNRVNRRALLRAGAAASPVLLTLASGPVAATNSVGCLVASSFVSVATFKSRNPNSTIACSTKNCESWRTEAGTIPLPPAYPALAGTVAALLGPAPSGYAGDTVQSVLLQGGSISTSGPLGVAQHFICLALSAKYGKLTSPGAVNLAYVQTVWASYNSTAPNYTAPSGVILSEAQLIGWLRAMLGYAIP